MEGLPQHKAPTNCGHCATPVTCESAGSCIEAYIQSRIGQIRQQTLEQCAGVLLGERGRLLKLQAGAFSGSRDAQIAKLYSMATRLRKLK